MITQANRFIIFLNSSIIIELLYQNYHANSTDRANQRNIPSQLRHIERVLSFTTAPVPLIKDTCPHGVYGDHGELSKEPVSHGRQPGEEIAADGGC
jgi:hypothetical protein